LARLDLPPASRQSDPEKEIGAGSAAPVFLPAQRLLDVPCGTLLLMISGVSLLPQAHPYPQH
jgi:hypothetical protein